MGQRRKILTVFYRHRPGGQCRRLYLMIESLLDVGCEVHYLSVQPLLLSPRENLVPHILKLPVRNFRGFWFWLCFSLVSPLALLRIALREQIATIAVLDTYYSCVSKLASLLARAPIILFLRSVPWRVNQIVLTSPIRRLWSALIDFIGLLSARTIVTVTSTMQEDLIQKVPILQPRIVTLPNAVIYPPGLEVSAENKASAERWEEWLNEAPQRKRKIIDEYQLPDRQILLATCGELNSRKNVEHLVRAVGASGNEKISLIICGDGPERSKMTMVVSGYGLRRQVVFAGWLDDPLPVVAASDLFVMTSRHEGMSNAMLEALGAGTAVIAADTPEMREVLHYDDLLFNPTNVGELARKLEQLTSKRGELQRLKELSHERARHFTFNWGKEVVNIVEGALAK